MYYFLAGDMILVFLMSLLINRRLHLKMWQLIIFTVAIVPVGFFCGKLMRLVEAGTWTGVSFYGAVLFAPGLMILIGLILQIKPADMLDLCAPAGCIALIFMKIQCRITGCCYGRILGYESHGRPIRFPSQIVELICGACLLVVLMILNKSDKQQGYVFAWFMVLYGASRFVLNLLRDTTPFLLGMSAGCFWSVISVIIGGVVLLMRLKRRSR